MAGVATNLTWWYHLACDGGMGCWVGGANQDEQMPMHHTRSWQRTGVLELLASSIPPCGRVDAVAGIRQGPYPAD